MLKICPFCKSTFKSKYSSQIFCKLVCANRFNRNGLKFVKVPIKSVVLAELIGIILGDGELSKYQIKVTLNTEADKDYILFVESLFKKLFPELIPFKKERKTEGCTIVGASSVVVALFFKKMGLVSWKPKIPTWIYENDDYVEACMRGLIDTEGSIGFKAYIGKNKKSIYRQLTFTSKNLILLEFIRNGFNKLGLKPTQSLIKNIYLSNDREIDIYRKLIGFHNPKLERKSLIRDYVEYINGRVLRIG